MNKLVNESNWSNKLNMQATIWNVTVMQCILWPLDGRPYRIRPSFFKRIFFSHKCSWNLVNLLQTFRVLVYETVIIAVDEKHPFKCIKSNMIRLSYTWNISWWLIIYYTNRRMLTYNYLISLCIFIRSCM